MAVMAGVDMSMVPNDYSFADLLIGTCQRKKSSDDRIDQAVRRILKVKYDLGLFENPMPSPTAKTISASPNMPKSVCKPPANL